MNTRSATVVIRFVTGLALLSSLMLGSFTRASAAQTCYVQAGASGTGSSWANAYGNPQSALANAACTEIWVAMGTYKTTITIDRYQSFELKNGVALYGGFAGTETLLTQRNPTANPTILSGEIGDAVRTDNSYHVVVASAVNATAILDGFKIMDGFAANGFGGGGMLNTGNSTATLRNLIFARNLATYGGGMYNEGSSPSLTSVVFTGNSGVNGAGLYNFTNSNPSLNNVTFAGDTASGGGGGIFNNQSNPILMNVTFTGNHANNGGGMFNQTSSPSLTNVTLSGNSASSLGGGMYNYNNSSPNLRNVTFSGNSAVTDGGGMYNDPGNPIITSSIFYGDTGGEIVNNLSTPTVTYSIIQGGYAGTGNLNVNPLLKPLGNYGGLTRTMPLSFGSPAIDHGTNTGCPATDQRGVIRPQDGDGNTTKVCDMGATESHLFIKGFQSIGAQDGWVLESTETSSIGGTLNSTAETFSVGDSTLRQQGRSILSFDTSSLPNNVQLTSAILKIKKQGVQGKDPFIDLGNLLVDVRKGAFSNNAALQLTDFQALASKNTAITILNNPLNGWYSRAMPAANLVYINKAGLTQFRLRFQLDDNNDNIADYLKFYSGNYLTNPALRPQLIIKYYLP